MGRGGEAALTTNIPFPFHRSRGPLEHKSEPHTNHQANYFSTYEGKKQWRNVNLIVSPPIAEP
jgi:hypothetical protein